MSSPASLRPMAVPRRRRKSADLEIIPRHRIPYRGVIDRGDGHRRDPGAEAGDRAGRRAGAHQPARVASCKAYEDVKVLRDAGIDVITTLNMQHLDSLQDVVAGITGVEVRETIPDRVLDDADVQLVDLPHRCLDRAPATGEGLSAATGAAGPAALLPAGQSDRVARDGSAAHRCRGRGCARPITCTSTASKRSGRQRSGCWCWSMAMPAAGVVLRNAWRLASALRGELIAAAVIPPGGLERLRQASGAGIEKNIALAEDLGAAGALDRDSAIWSAASPTSSARSNAH